MLALAEEQRKTLIVGLDVALKGPYPLVGEGEMSPTSEISPIKRGIIILYRRAL